MNDSGTTQRRSVFATVAIGFLWCAWQAVRLPFLALLIVFEPLVRIILSGFVLVGTLTAFIFEFATCAPQLIGTAADQSIAATLWDSYGMMPPC